MDKREISAELQLRSTQILELRQKIFDSNEGNNILIFNLKNFGTFYSSF